MADDTGQVKTISTLLRKFLIQYTKKLKGFSKDPFFYLVIISIVLFGLASFTPRFENKTTYTASLILSSNQLPLENNGSKKIFIEPTNFQPESPDFYLIQKSSLLGVSPPVTVTTQVLGVILGESEPEIKKEIIEYQVQSGDNLTTIAENFGISLNTILWANDLTSYSTIRPGQKLIILPVSGVVHHVKAGDTISEIAKKYKAKTEEIITFNELSSEGDIFVGDILILPNGIMPTPQRPVYVEVPVASSYFICPIVSPCRVTQRLHWYNAVDFSHGKCGESIYAAAGGVVQRVKYGWNNGAGNTITILHPNGVVTTYGHILTSLVSPGDQVSQGQIIALMGGQTGAAGAGRSTGCHLHFGVQGAKNPFR